ncbi:glycerophosphoryl diester phosphodiesterase [Opitutaceae bacterium TAV1]|nr:glycerophosphoryl diester phosphodiesterase [Opitutaceae bacterium TAV1]
MAMPFRLIAHRGAPMRAPENTLASFRIAQQLGATEIETDVQLTTDNVLVLCHDDTLARYRLGDRRVEESPCEAAAFSDEPPPDGRHEARQRRDGIAGGDGPKGQPRRMLSGQPREQRAQSCGTVDGS